MPKLIQLYYAYLGGADLRLKFSSIPKDGSDSHTFSGRKWVLIMYTVGKFQT